jgi:hypothetical protein
MAPVLQAVATLAIDKVPVDVKVVLNCGSRDMFGDLDIRLAFLAEKDALAMDGPDHLHVPLCACIRICFLIHAQAHTKKVATA